MVRITDLMQNNPTQQKPSITYNTHGKVRPLNPAGRIVNDSVLDTPVEYIKDFGKDVVFLKNGITGKSNDHELGKINDFSMKLGGLALAAYLCKKNTQSLNKVMEFVGVASFFGTMALWPKLFIQLPIKLMHGVDIHKKFVDSEGRKKMFFQDPQYIPWDILTHNDIERLGDKMGIPKNVHHRQGITKENAQRIATQGNTLWMWTAGFATPLGSALVCNGLEKFLSPRLAAHAIRKADASLRTIGSAAKSSSTKALEKFLSTHSGQPVDTRTLSKIKRFFVSSDYVQLNPAINKELQTILAGGTLDNNAVQTLRNLKGQLDNFSSDFRIVQNYAKVYKEHALAHSFNGVMDTLLKGLKGVALNKDELAQFAVNGKSLTEKQILAKGGDKALELLMLKLGKVAQSGNEGQFKKLVSDLSKAIEKFDGTFNEGFRTTFEGATTTVSNIFKDTPFAHIKQAISGQNKESFIGTVSKGMSEQVTGARACLYKMLQILDLEKRISTGELKTQFDKLSGTAGVSYEEVKTLARQVLKSKTTSDYMQKFRVSPNTYRTVSRLLYGEEYGANAANLYFHPETVSSGMSSGLKSRISSFFKQVKDEVMAFETKLRLNHNFGSAKGSPSPTGKHLLIGAPVDDLVDGALKKHFNARKWLKITGIAAGVLVAATLLTEAFFIGKSKIHKKDQNK